MNSNQMDCWIKINAVLLCFYYISDPGMNHHFSFYSIIFNTNKNPK